MAGFVDAWYNGIVKVQIFLMAILAILVALAISVYLVPDRWDSLLPRAAERPSSGSVGRS